MWVSKSLDLGSIRQGQSLDFNFVYTGELEILSATPSCSSCTVVKAFDSVNKVLPVVYKAGAFPQHLILEGKSYYDSTKIIHVTYTNGQKEDLYFKVRVYK